MTTNTMRTMGAVVGVLGALSVVTTASDARADVANPGYFEFIVTSGHDSALWFASGHHMELSNGGTGYFSAELASDGTASDVGSSFPVGTFVDVASNTIKATLEFRSTSEGVVDVQTSSLDFYNIQARVRFTYNSGTPCTTSNFSIDLSTANWSPVVQGVCSTPYDRSTGTFCMVASDFRVPELPGPACDGNGDAINSFLTLGGTGYMQILLGQASPTVL